MAVIVLDRQLQELRKEFARFIEVDYRQRLAPQRLLAALQEQAVG